MTPERWERIKAVFAAVEELPEGEAAALLAELCGDDEELRWEVAELLAEPNLQGGTAALRDRLAGPAAAVFGGDAAALVGSTVGAYRVERVLGTGGMGTVYAARREQPYEQLVALKVIRAGLHSSEVLRRFQTERQILAGLDHPNIARLLDGDSTPDGRPYLVMEHVEGLPIDRFCAERNLSLRARLELFRAVCAAVHYAHQRLVVHRDLKPGNVLVTADGTPKLLDFGISKVLETDAGVGVAEVTATEHRMLTPEYASPEQVTGAVVTTATDVYSLGVLLYRLVSGEMPYPVGASGPQAALHILETTPERPSARAGRQRGVASGERALWADLDTVVLEALHKEPERRYGSALDLGEDLRRCLAGEPVMARPDTLRYRARKFVARNRGAVVAAAAAVLALVIATGVTAVQAVAARRAEEQARAAQARAEQRFTQLRQLARVMLFELDDVVAPLAGSTPAREALVRNSLVYLDSLAREDSELDLQLELASGYRRIGDIQGNYYHSNLGQTAAAAESYRKALAIATTALQRAPRDPAVLAVVADVRYGAGDVAYSGNELQRAADLYRASISAWDQRAALQAPDVEQERQRADAYHNLGDVLGNPSYANLGQSAAALVALSKALDIRQALAQEHPDHPRLPRDLHVSLSTLSNLLLATGDSNRAEEHARRAMAMITEVAARHPEHAPDQRDVARGAMILGMSLQAVGRYDEALDQLRRSLAIVERLAAADPGSAYFKRSRAVVASRLADALNDSGRHGEALAELGRVRPLLDELYSLDPDASEAATDLLLAWRRRGEALRALGRHSEAVEALERGAAVVGGGLADGSNRSALLESAILDERLGAVLAQGGNEGKGREHLLRAESALARLAAESPDQVRVQHELATARFDLAGSLLADGDAESIAAGCRYLGQARATWSDLASEERLPVRAKHLLPLAARRASACNAVGGT